MTSRPARFATRGWTSLLATAVTLITACGATGPNKAAPPTTQTSATTATTASTTTTLAAPTTSKPAPTAPPPTTPPTTTSAPAVIVATGRAARSVIALTFDAGSDAGHTSQILDTLAANHIHATFGITGLWAQANPTLVRLIAASGDQIVNHSWDHQSFTGGSTHTQALTAAQIDQELGRTDALIRQLTGTGTAGWFRPPYGDRDPAVDTAAGAAGYHWELMWTVDTLGWQGVNPETVVQRCVAAATPGEIILMHVGSASTDAQALPAVIAALQARGFGFVTVSALI